MRNHPQKPAFNQRGSPPFADDAPKDNFSRGLWLRCSRSCPRGVFPSSSSCFLTQNSWPGLWGSTFQCCWKPGMCVQQLCYVGGGCWGLVFFDSRFFACHPTLWLQLPLSLPPHFLLLFNRKCIVFQKKPIREGWVTTTSPLLSRALNHHSTRLLFLCTLHSRRTSLPAPFNTVILAGIASFFL